MYVNGSQVWAVLLLLGQADEKQEVQQSNNQVENKSYLTVYDRILLIRPDNQHIGEDAPHQEAGQGELVAIAQQPLEPTEGHQDPPAQELLHETSQWPVEQGHDCQHAELGVHEWGREQSVELVVLQILWSQHQGLAGEVRDLQEWRVGHY